jgi:bacteriorhodopsin
MENVLKIITWLYIILDFFILVFFLFQIKKFNGTSKNIIIILIISSSWAISNNIYWFFNKTEHEITKKIPLFFEYTDYIITTALALVALALFSMMYLSKSKVIIAIFVIADAIMLSFGALAEYCGPTTMRYVYYWIGVIPFIIILYLIWKTQKLKAKSQSTLLYKSYVHLSIYLTFFWMLYPLLWYLGPFVFNLFNMLYMQIAYNIVNIFTKACFYYFIYRKLILLKEKSEGGLQ